MTNSTGTARSRFEDLRVGTSIALGPVSVSRADIIAFARAYDPLPFHLDETAARNSLLGGLAASGWQTGALTLKMLSDAWLGSVDQRGLCHVANLKWRKPVYVDDVVAGTATIADLRDDPADPITGIADIDIDIALANAGGDTVLTMRLSYRIVRAIAGAHAS